MALFNANSIVNKSVEAKNIAKSNYNIIRFEKSFQFELSYIADLPEFPKNNEIYYLWAFQTFSAFSVVLKLIEKYKTIDELVISTFNIGKNVIDLLMKFLNDGTVKELHILVNDKFERTLKDNYKVEILTSKAKQVDNFTFAFAYNHSKVNCIKVNNNFYVLEGSGNSSKKSGIEQYILYNNEKGYSFRADFIKQIIIDNR